MIKNIKKYATSSCKTTHQSLTLYENPVNFLASVDNETYNY